MGKRELLLMLGFVVAGVAVYWVTAPAARPGEQHRSVLNVIADARKELRGHQGSADLRWTETLALAPDTTELRLGVAKSFRAHTFQVIGEDRADLAAEFHVTSNGVDHAEAEQLARQVKLTANEAAGRMGLDLDFPEEGRQSAELILRVPARCAIVVSRADGEVTVRDTASLELLETRGETVVKDVRGRVSGTHRGGDLTIAGASAVTLAARGSDVHVTGVTGDVAFDGQGGSLEGAGFSGALDVRTSGTDVTLAALDASPGPIRVNADGGSITLKGIAATTRADVRGADVEVQLAKNAPVAIYTDGSGGIEITPAPGGYTLDARTAGGAITLPAETLTVDAGDGEQHAAGEVHGGGPRSRSAPHAATSSCARAGRRHRPRPEPTQSRQPKRKRRRDDRRAARPNRSRTGLT
jgi:hypothetical protein